VRRGREGDGKLPRRRRAATSDLHAARRRSPWMRPNPGGVREGAAPATPLPKECRACRTGEQSKKEGEREREGEGGVALALLGKGRGRATTSRGRVLGTIK
jgi:hypothetical protein